MARGGFDSHENVFMLRVLPYDTAADIEQGIEWLVVKASSPQPDKQWESLTQAITNEITEALNNNGLTLPASGAMWEPDLTDLWVLWCDPADWWTDMTKISERNCSAVLDMMRERGHQDALSVRLLYQGQSPL
jgi:hypothetical protein